MQGKKLEVTAALFFFLIFLKNSLNIYKLLSLHFTGLVFLRMVTATVQCERHQRERSDGNGAVLQKHTPETPGRGCAPKTHPTNPGNGAVLQNKPQTPLGGQGWSLGDPQSARRECHKVPALVCTPGGSPYPPHPGVILPRDALAGHLWGEGSWEWGWECCTWLDSPNPPCSHLGVASAAPLEQGHEGGAGFLLHAGKGGGG